MFEDFEKPPGGESSEKSEEDKFIELLEDWLAQHYPKATSWEDATAAVPAAEIADAATKHFMNLVSPYQVESVLKIDYKCDVIDDQSMWLVNI